MPHIPLDPNLPGILGLFAYRPDTAQLLGQFTELLLRGPSTLTPGERELIAAHVSSKNGCHFCHQSHAAAAAAHLERGPELAAEIAAGEHPVSPKMAALLAIAGRVQESGRSVAPEQVEAARAAGASDREIHDAVLIAAAFCMFNRYVDGLGTWAPEPPEAYVEVGQRLATQGYLLAS